MHIFEIIIAGIRKGILQWDAGILSSAHVMCTTVSIYISYYFSSIILKFRGAAAPSALPLPLSLNACKLFLCQIMFSPFPQSLFCTTSRQFCFHAILLAPGHLIDQFSQTEQTNRVYWMPEGYYNTKIFRHDGNVARLNVCRQEWRKQKQSGPIRVCLCSGEICDEIRASSYIACLISGPQSLQSGCTPYQPN